VQRGSVTELCVSGSWLMRVLDYSSRIGNDPQTLGEMIAAANHSRHFRPLSQTCDRQVDYFVAASFGRERIPASLIDLRNNTVKPFNCVGVVDDPRMAGIKKARDGITSAEALRQARCEEAYFPAAFLLEGIQLKPALRNRCRGAVKCRRRQRHFLAIFQQPESSTSGRTRWTSTFARRVRKAAGMASGKPLSSSTTAIRQSLAAHAVLKALSHHVEAKICALVAAIQRPENLRARHAADAKGPT